MNRIFLVFFVITLGLWNNTTATAADESPFRVFIWAVAGPVRANAVAFDEWSTNVVSAIYDHGSPSNPIEYRLRIENISQPTPTQNNSNNLWFVVRVVAKDASTKFLPSRLRFSGGSSDPSNYLKSTSSLAVDNYTYTPRLMGVLWNGAPRNADVLLASPAGGKISEVAVNEVIFIGAQSAYFTYGDQSGLTAIDNFIMGFPNYLVTGIWSLVDGGGNVVARASKTLETKGIPIPPFITLDASGVDVVTLGIDMETNRSAILFSSTMTPPIKWVVENTVNAGDMLVRPKKAKEFFRILLQ